MSLLELPDAPSFPWKNDDEYSRGVVVDAYIPSSILEEGREVYIYLPSDYNKNRTTPYPLVVTFDGDIYKDFIEAPAIFDFLIKEGKIPPLIAIMIEKILSPIWFLVFETWLATSHLLILLLKN